MNAKKKPLAYLRDRFVPAEEAALRVYDLGVVLGATVSEMTRTFRHEPFRLEDHVDRFFHSCRVVGLSPPVDPDEMIRLGRELVSHNAARLGPTEDLAMVQFLTPGESNLYAGRTDLPEPPEPTFVMHTFRLPFRRWRHLFTEGAHVVTPSIRHVPPPCIDPRVKCRSRMHWWLAQNEARAIDPHAIPLCLSVDGHVTETPSANVLIVRDGRVLSPPPELILPGVSLRTVRELCDELAIPFAAGPLRPEDVAAADEALLTSTPFSMAPVTRFNGQVLGSGRPTGPTFRRLTAAWNKRAGMDIIGQIMHEVDERSQTREPDGIMHSRGTERHGTHA